MTTAQRRRESDGDIAHRAAVEFIRSCTGNEIVAFVPDAPPLWWRLYDGKESKGALFERTVLKDCLPASLNTIYAQAKAAGFEVDGFYGAVGHWRGHFRADISR